MEQRRVGGFDKCPTCGREDNRSELATGKASQPNPKREQRKANARKVCDELHDTSTECLAACDELKIIELEERAERAERELAALKFTIVTTIGGTDNEGNPTSEINYLQRLRRLVDAEKENQP